ncbi:hypothetical protein GMA12_11675 [Kocuria sediminis]|uniref:STAS domain-containing protein n=1 Tax=Kocuria sediminis TaxID=1038857 RepID=A0A6N8GNC6_9MICC|nr:hypothetical protein [Kocuria sediminis]MUN63790.1 hypothetical protein [Kocuria sediminis]
MELQLSVLVQIDLDGRHVRLVVTGCLTEANQQCLHPLIRRARALTSQTTVLVDLSCARIATASTVDLLRWAAEHENSCNGSRPVSFLLPTAGVEPPAGASPGARPSEGARP